SLSFSWSDNRFFPVAVRQFFNTCLAMSTSNMYSYPFHSVGAGSGNPSDPGTRTTASSEPDHSGLLRVPKMMPLLLRLDSPLTISINESTFLPPTPYCPAATSTVRMHQPPGMGQ